MTETGLLQAQNIDNINSLLNNRGANKTNDVPRTFRTLPNSPNQESEKFLSSPSSSGDGGSSGGYVYYNIHILGEVNRPGTYKALPSDRVTDGVKYAGGISENGSQKVVELRRQGKRTQILDLFSYKYKGMLDQNPYLIENDVIFVPLKQGEFEVEGPVKRPGKYEMTGSLTLEKAINIAGGFGTGRSTQTPIRVIRFDENEKKAIIKVENNELDIQQFNIQKGDIVVIPHMLTAQNKFDYNLKQLPGDHIFYPTLNDQVYVSGAVSAPGPYPFQPGLTVSNYISQAGPNDKSSIKRVKIIGPDGKKRSVTEIEQINPGDTIFVPVKAVTVTNALAWFGTISSLALTSFVFVDRFGK